MMRGTTIKGLVGTLFPAAGAAVSLATVEAWLRVASLVVGLAVGVLTLISLIRQRRKGTK